MKVTLLLATRNRHKVSELRKLLDDLPVRLLCMQDFSGAPVREDGTTFRDNAVKKALALSRWTILPVLAEDSGLHVRALGGRPGVRSARYACPRLPAVALCGGQAPTLQWRARGKKRDRANIAKLLRAMGGIPSCRRQARFVCVMALAVGGRCVRTFQGVCAGSIAANPAGTAGFGYDPVFIPRGFRRTMAQLGLRRKNRISHRALAARKLKAWIKTALRGCPGG